MFAFVAFRPPSFFAPDEDAVDPIEDAEARREAPSRVGLAEVEVEVEERREAEVTVRGAGEVVARPITGGFAVDVVGVAGFAAGLSHVSKKSSSVFSAALDVDARSVAPSTYIPAGYLIAIKVKMQTSTL